jgi:hypothetical protein
MVTHPRLSCMDLSEAIWIGLFWSGNSIQLTFPGLLSTNHTTENTEPDLNNDYHYIPPRFI